MVIWITGLSGSGKTTLARYLYNDLIKKLPNTIWIDGDNFTRYFDPKIGYSLEDRKIRFKRAYSFIKFCNDQNLYVIVSILRFDKKIERDNKKYFKKYYQIYLNSDIKTLIKRDNRNIYSNALKKKKPNIVGYDIKWDRNLNSDIEIKDFFKLKKNDIKKITNKILKKFQN